MLRFIPARRFMPIGRCLPVLAWLCLTSCGGGGYGSGGGGGGGQQTYAPTLANLTLSPAAVYVGSGSGKATVEGSATFTATGSALSTATITVLGAGGAIVSSQNVPIQGAGASGGLVASASITTAKAGTFTVQVYATNAAGQKSNTITATFRINPFPWRQGSAMPTPRYNGAVVTIGSKLYVLGGELVASPISPAPPVDNVEVLDAATDTWATAAPLPVTIDYGVAAAVAGVIYVVGGRSTTGPCSQIANVYAFDPATGMWTQKAAIPAPVQGAASVAIGSMIYVLGGARQTCPETATAAATVYDTATDSWSSITALPQASAFPGAGVVNGKIEVFGGATVMGVSIDSNVNLFAEFDPATGNWTSRPMAAIGAAAPATATVGGVLYEFGGLSSLGPAVQGNAAYDPVTATWKTKESLPNLTVTGPMAGSYNGLIYSFGQAGTWIYDPANDVNP